MKRTIRVPAARCCPLFLVAAALAQEVPPAGGGPGAEEQRIHTVVAAMQAAEASAKSLWLEIETTGRMPGGMRWTTRGTLRVLQGEHPAVNTPAAYSIVEYEFDQDLSGRIETVKTNDGIDLFEDNPTFGEVFLHIDQATVADLEWAGEVLQRRDLPGVGDGRGAAALGSEVVRGLQDTYVLVPLERKDRAGEAGQWFGGGLRKGVLPDLEPDLPLADRVELFVRAKDHALLEVVKLQTQQPAEPLERIVVTKVERDVPLAPESFRIEPKGVPRKMLREHPAWWEMAQDALRKAEAKLEGKEVRPSRRPRAR
jgi:hypothetical protein